MLIDLHTHSYPKSDDSFMSVDELIDSAKATGLDGVCLTEHDIFWSADEVHALATKHNFLVLPGCEINTDTGHLLVFGLERYEFGLHKPSFLRHVVEREAAVAIAAHPFRRRFLEEPGRHPEARAEMLQKASEDSIFQMCQAIESINGRGTPEQNKFSTSLGRFLGAKMTGGSDAHRVAQFGTAATQFERPVANVGELITELKEGRFKPIDLKNGRSGSHEAH